MAYCVNCGVKLADGTTVCSLCKTPVHAPLEIIGEKGEPFFPSSDERKSIVHPLFDKNRKGLIELVIAFMVIAIVTLLITSFALVSFSPWVSIGCVVLGTGYLLVALFVKPSYVKIATWFVGITVLLLTIIDLGDLRISWSLYANLSVLLFWICFVFPFMYAYNKKVFGLTIALISIPLYFMALNLLSGTGLTWSISIALPTYLATLVALAVLVLRIHLGKPTITDVVLSLIAVSCIGVVAGDFFHLRTIKFNKLLSWSSSVMVVAIAIIIFLVLNLTLRRVRHFFNNRTV
jgi:hypothetical protein